MIFTWRLTVRRSGSLYIIQSKLFPLLPGSNPLPRLGTHTYTLFIKSSTFVG